MNSTLSPIPHHDIATADNVSTKFSAGIVSMQDIAQRQRPLSKQGYNNIVHLKILWRVYLPNFISWCCYIDWYELKTIKKIVVSSGLLII